MVRYLFQKNGTYYFRRRIAGYPHKSAPLMVSLGSKDYNYALYLVQHLQTEYQSMLNTFTFIHPPLPEDLVRTYMANRLRRFVRDMQRNMRMARMSGRMSDNDQSRVDIHKVVLRAMLEHGLQKTFPPQAIDPNWSNATLETTMRIYNQEYHVVILRPPLGFTGAR